MNGRKQAKNRENRSGKQTEKDEELPVFELTPRLEYFNTYGDHATIRDNKLGLYIDLYPQENGTILCKHCESTDCEHVKFALTVPDIIEPLEKHGWKYKG